MEMAFLCKKVSKPLGTGNSRADGKCKKAFRKDMTAYEEADEYCPHCDNQYVSRPSQSHLSFRLTLYQVIAAKEPQAMIGVEGEDARMDSRYVYTLFKYRPADLCSPPPIILISQLSYPHNLLWNRYRITRMIKDDREKTKPERSVFAEKDLTDKVDSYWGRA